MSNDLKKYKRLYGLIGYPLSHSFSKKYFGEKFEKSLITDEYYDLFPMKDLNHLCELPDEFSNLVGLNVTIPYKEKVLDFLDEIDPEAAAVGAVNTIKIKDGKWKGYNTDIYGFEQSLLNVLSNQDMPKSGLILGTGGASKAVAYVLKKLNISIQLVSRTKGENRITYEDLDKKKLEENHLIVNTTPLGTFPNIHEAPNIDYSKLNENHLLYDLVYNPEMTLFLKNGKKHGTSTKNGLEMLYLQAEKAYSIWND